MTNFDPNLFDELQWRGMVSDATEGLKEQFASERVTAYIGFDPTASSQMVPASVLPNFAPDAVVISGQTRPCAFFPRTLRIRSMPAVMFPH